MIRRLVTSVLVGLVLALAPRAHAQEVRTEIAAAPYYAGQPIALHVVATQFEDDPTPTVEFDPQSGLEIRFAGVSPSTSTAISIVNGRITRTHDVSFTYRYELVSDRTGPVLVPAFRVRQGSTLRSTRSFQLEIASVPSSDEFGIAVVLPAGPIFVGQRVPVVIEFRIDEEAANAIVDYRLRVPLFDAPGVRFIDSRPPKFDTQLAVQTASGLIQLPAVTEQRVIGGRASVVLRAERILVAQKPGRIAAPAPTVTVERGTAFSRDFFGQSRPVQTQRSIASGRPVDVEVAELPSQGRPPSFAGAVGTDFSLEVTADRSVVQLGEPIELTFRLRGHGDLASAGLPALDVEGLFDPAQFRLPEDLPAGLLDGDAKVFRATVRVLDASVREIPALDYSWFDAETRRFETVRSQPIALSVGAAQLVGADAVTSSGEPQTAAAASGEAGSPSSEEGAGRSDAEATLAANAAGSDGKTRVTSLAESAANFAIERDPEQLLQASRSERGAGLAVYAGYGVGLALLALGLLDRRRRAIDPALRARLAALEAARRGIEAAIAGSARNGADGAAEPSGAAALGRALRELVAAQPGEASAELDAIVAECDALRFAPAGSGVASGSSVPEALAARARRLVDERMAAAKTPRRRFGGPSLMLVLAAFVWGGSVARADTPSAGAPAPEPTAVSVDARGQLERAIADYEAAQSETDRDARIAGFARAERGFAAVVEGGSASAALHTNLGNAAFQAGRIGDAVLAYHRALRLDPEAATARQNLAHVRSRLPAWVPKPSDEQTVDVMRLDRRVPLQTRSLAASVCFALSMGALALSWRSAGAWRGLAIFFGLAWGLLVTSVVAEGRGEGGKAAVVIADETPARSSDSVLAPLAFPDPLPAGVEVELLERRGDFSRIRLANGRDVWVRGSNVTEVAG